MKDKLIELIRNAPKFEFPSGSRAQGKTYQTSANLADYLIANGVVILDPKKYPPVTNRDMLDTIMGVPLDEMAALIEEKKKGERKQSEGEWSPTDFKDEVYEEYYECSACKRWNFKSAYCPNCGAKMKGAADERSD